ncbi:MAG TPA: ribose 5-phosphate isomerase B [Rhodospirillaceae bacterium]|nr:ribose 5-phosphate isomerase B [Rhodospirillaceae bacterium]|tara:strand:+ start:1945 stop:2379 length:435 start_codon:yes stop_codon:yes gene_type:complete
MSKETIGIAADHGGFFLKRAIAEEIEAAGYQVLDLGTDSEKSVDYPDYAEKLVRAISDGSVKKGVLVCGTGIGISIAANRHMGIRAALCYDKETAVLARQHNDANILCLGGRKTAESQARQLVALFLDTEFEGGRHERRVEKLG